jgi:ribose 5-phosphate isomerase A
MGSSQNNDRVTEDNKCIKLSLDFFKRYITEGNTIGLGSGSTVEKIVRNFGLLEYKDSLEFIVTSLQIRIVSESIGLKIVDQNKNATIDVVLDGADQIDSNYNMIKGGGGALLREKILISSSQKFVIIAQASKFVDKLTIAVPVEVTPFITENGNIIYDTLLPKYDNLKETERDIKNIPGVIEVGLFTDHADSYYKITGENDFELVTPKRG